jgi:hypothetical protein
MKAYAKLYVRKITDIVTLGMQNEVRRKYLDSHSVIGRIGLLRVFEISLKRRKCVKRRHEENF